MSVGVRELKAKLSEYLGRVAAGETIVVTDRGTPVACLTPVAGQTSIDRGIEQGWIEPARRTRLVERTRVSAAMSVMDALDEDRG